MLTIGSIVSGLGYVVANLETFKALGADIVGMFTAGKALIASDTASTAEERASALSEIEALEAQRDTRLEALKRLAPDS
jgi:hypothetical protein